MSKIINFEVARQNKEAAKTTIKNDDLSGVNILDSFSNFEHLMMHHVPSTQENKFLKIKEADNYSI